MTTLEWHISNSTFKKVWLNLNMIKLFNFPIVRVCCQKSAISQLVTSAEQLISFVFNELRIKLSNYEDISKECIEL
jgi:hypothetical protein